MHNGHDDLLQTMRLTRETYYLTYTPVHLALAEEVAGVTGAYFVNRRRKPCLRRRRQPPPTKAGQLHPPAD